MSATYLQDLYFVAIVLQLAVGFSIAFFFLKGLWWLAVVAGLCWILLGLGSMTRTEIFYYQRTLAIVFIVIGIGMFFMPAWYKRREQKSGAEVLEESDGGHYNEMDSDLDYLNSESNGYRGRKKVATK